MCNWEDSTTYGFSISCLLYTNMYNVRKYTVTMILNWIELLLSLLYKLTCMKRCIDIELDLADDIYK